MEDRPRSNWNQSDLVDKWKKNGQDQRIIKMKMLCAEGIGGRTGVSPVKGQMAPYEHRGRPALEIKAGRVLEMAQWLRTFAALSSRRSEAHF